MQPLYLQERCKQIFGYRGLLFFEQKEYLYDSDGYRLSINKGIGGKEYMNKIQNCEECEFMKMYNYGKKIYYCNHENRKDDLGKLRVGHLPEINPEWCPIKEK